MIYIIFYITMSIIYNNSATNTTGHKQHIKITRIYKKQIQDNLTQYYDIGGFNQFIKDQFIHAVQLINFNTYVQIDIRQLINKLRMATTAQQFINTLVMVLIKSKQRQQTNCKYINSRLQKQLQQQRQTVIKYENIIENLKFCNEQTKQYYQQIQHDLKIQIRQLKEQNFQLGYQLQQIKKQVNKNIQKRVQVPNFKRSYQNCEKTQKIQPKIRRIQSELQISTELQLLKQLQNMQKFNIKSNQVTFCEYKSIIDDDSRYNREELKEQLLQLRQNHKKLQTILQQKDKQIQSLAKLLNLYDGND